MKCFFCKEEGMINIEGKNYCKECFLKIYERKVERLIKRFSLILPDDKVLVCISGGKDSISLGYVLKKLGYDFEALWIDVGVRKCKDERLEKHVEWFCKELDIKLHKISVTEYLGFSIERDAKSMKRPVCSICGMVKRYIFNRFARENGFTKIATGHNLDDVLMFFFKNFLAKHWDWVAKLKPITYSTHPKIVTRIKPLFECSEKENYWYAKLNGILLEDYKCMQFRVKDKWKEFLQVFEEKLPETKLLFIKALEELRVEVKEEKFYECEICGEPASGEICGVCKLKGFSRKNL
jgi:uncharacterized protein (TIGR00269 family)